MFVSGVIRNWRRRPFAAWKSKLFIILHFCHSIEISKLQRKGENLEKKFLSRGTVVVRTLPVSHFDQVQVVASLEFKVCVLSSTHPALLWNRRLRFRSPLLCRLLTSSPSGLPFLLLCRLFLVLLGRLLAFLSRPLFFWPRNSSRVCGMHVDHDHHQDGKDGNEHCHDDLLLFLLCD